MLGQHHLQVIFFEAQSMHPLATHVLMLFETFVVAFCFLFCGWAVTFQVNAVVGSVVMNVCGVVVWRHPRVYQVDGMGGGFFGSW